MKTYKVPIELANALTTSRLDNPAGKVKEALSNALWSITSIPEVALYVTQNFDFLQVIIDTIKQGPDSDSETHTGKDLRDSGEMTTEKTHPTLPKSYPNPNSSLKSYI